MHFIEIKKKHLSELREVFLPKRRRLSMHILFTLAFNYWASHFGIMIKRTSYGRMNFKKRRDAAPQPWNSRSNSKSGLVASIATTTTRHITYMPRPTHTETRSATSAAVAIIFYIFLLFSCSSLALKCKPYSAGGYRTFRFLLFAFRFVQIVFRCV